MAAAETQETQLTRREELASTIQLRTQQTGAQSSAGSASNGGSTPTGNAIALQAPPGNGTSQYAGRNTERTTKRLEELTQNC